VCCRRCRWYAHRSFYSWFLQHDWYISLLWVVCPRLTVEWPQGSFVALAQRCIGRPIVAVPSNPDGLLDWGLPLARDMGVHITAAWVARARMLLCRAI
jgi:hypothetical protein